MGLAISHFPAGRLSLASIYIYLSGFTSTDNIDNSTVKFFIRQHVLYNVMVVMLKADTKPKEVMQINLESRQFPRLIRQNATCN